MDAATREWLEPMFGPVDQPQPEFRDGVLVIPAGWSGSISLGGPPSPWVPPTQCKASAIPVASSTMTVRGSDGTRVQLWVCQRCGRPVVTPAQKAEFRKDGILLPFCEAKSGARIDRWVNPVIPMGSPISAEDGGHFYGELPTLKMSALQPTWPAQQREAARRWWEATEEERQRFRDETDAAVFRAFEALANEYEWAWANRHTEVET